MRKLISEMRAGLEGVTPGPWKLLGSGQDCWVTDAAGLILQDGYDGEMKEEDAAHIARCSPDNIAALLDAHDELVAALKRSLTAIDDWLNTFASEHCDEKRVAAAWARIFHEGGTLAYIASIQEQNRAALSRTEGEQTS